MAHGPRRKLFDFGGNPDHVRLGLGLGLRAVRCIGYARHTILCDTRFVGENRVIPRDIGRRRIRRILLSHSITIQSTHSTVAGCDVCLTVTVLRDIHSLHTYTNLY